MGSKELAVKLRRDNSSRSASVLIRLSAALAIRGPRERQDDLDEGPHVAGPVDPRRVVIVGDTPRDVECAHAHGCFAFAVATGRYSAEALAAAGADRVVADFRDPTPLFEILDGLARSR